MKPSLRAVTAWVIVSSLSVPGLSGLALSVPGLMAPAAVAAQIFQPGRPAGPGMPRQPMRPPMTTAPPETEQPTQPTFRTTVELVELTVVATRKDGQFAGDLTASDFQIFDEGTPQTISAFAKVDIPLPLPPEPARADAPAATGATGSSGAPAPPPDDVATSSLNPDARLFVLVLDDLHVASERTQRVRESARKFVERHTTPADFVAIVTPSGRKDMLLGFTRDRARLLAIIDQFHGQKLRSATYERDVDKRFGGGSGLRDGRDPSDGERAYRARVSMTTLADLSTMLAATQGRRKSLLYFSEGIDYNVADVMGSAQRYASEVTHTIAHALSTAIRTNVALYAIDPRGLTTTESDAVEMPIYAERAITDLAEPGRGGELGTSIRSLRDLAEPTGGFAATDTNDLDAAFARIVRENSTYYVIGFQPSKRASGGTFRKIDVRVTKPGVTIATRRGYLVPRRAAPASEKPEKPENTTAAATAGLSPELGPLLASALPASGLPIRVQAIPFKGGPFKGGPFKDGTSKTSLHLVVEIDGRDLTFASKDSHFTEELTVAMVTIDSSGHAANGAQTSLVLKLTPEELARVKTTGLRWQAALDLTPGHHQLRIAARAVGSARRGLAIAEIDVPDFTAQEVGMSGIALTSLPSVLAITSGRKPPFVSLTGPPTATREFVVGDRITAAAQVYSAAAHEDGLRVTARVEAAPGAPGAPDADRPKPLEATRRIAAAAGAREEVPFTFGTDAMPPGQYILTIRAHRPDGTTLAERRVAYAIVKK
jgi:VWFA-related protein